MKVRLEQPNQYLRRFEVTIPASKVDAAFNQVVNELKRRAHIPGFRAGKAPNSVIFQRFRSSIDAEVLTTLIDQRLITELLTQHQLNPVSEFQVDPGKLAQGADFSFALQFEVLPEVQIEGLEELEVAVPPALLQDEEIDARLERMRQADAQYRLAEGRQEVAAGDEVTMDYVVVVDGLEQPLEERTAIKVRVGAQSRFPDEVEAALAKAVLEQATPVGFTFPEGHPNKDLAGKPSPFTFTVREIKEKLVPELDDEWARDHEQESLAELRASVTAELRQEKDQAREHQVEQAILGKLVEKHPFEIPPGLAKAEVDKRMEGLLRMFGGSAEGLGEETFESLRRATRDRAHEDIRKAVLIRAIIGQEKIEVADAEGEARIGELAQKGPESPAKIRARYAPEQARETLRADLQEERALAFLKSKVRIVEAEVPATTEA